MGIKKMTFLVILFVLTVAVRGQQINRYRSLKFDRVLMYDYSPYNEKAGKIINSKGELASTVIKKTQLDNQVIKDLNSKLGDIKSFGGITASCFDPHLGFVYYLKDKVVAHISICFSCNRLLSSIDLPAQKQGKIGTGNDAYYISDGLSKKFRSFLNGLVTKHGFSHQIMPGSNFDK